MVSGIYHPHYLLPYILSKKMSRKSTQRIWAVMMIVSLTSTAVLSQSLGDCLSSPILSSMCTENDVQRKLVMDSNGHMYTCIWNMLTPS